MAAQAVVGLALTVEPLESPTNLEGGPVTFTIKMDCEEFLPHFVPTRSPFVDVAVTLGGDNLAPTGVDLSGVNRVACAPGAQVSGQQSYRLDPSRVFEALEPIPLHAEARVPDDALTPLFPIAPDTVDSTIVPAANLHITGPALWLDRSEGAAKKGDQAVHFRVQSNSNFALHVDFALQEQPSKIRRETNCDIIFGCDVVYETIDAPQGSATFTGTADFPSIASAPPGNYAGVIHYRPPSGRGIDNFLLTATVTAEKYPGGDVLAWIVPVEYSDGKATGFNASPQNSTPPAGLIAVIGVLVAAVVMARRFH